MMTDPVADLLTRIRNANAIRMRHVKMPASKLRVAIAAVLAEEGFISIFIALEPQTGKVIVGPEIHARGFAEDDKVFDEIRPKIVKALAEAGEQGVRDQHQYQQVVRRTVGRWVGTRIRRRPMIVPVVIEA